MNKSQSVSCVVVRPVRTLTIRFALILVVPVLFGATGCGSESKGPQAKASAPTAIRIGVAQPSPAAARSLANLLISDSLVGIRSDGRPVDRLVSEWAWTADQLGLRLRLRPNLQFHDGTPIDIAYFKQSLEATIEAARKEPPESDAMVSDPSVIGIEVDPNERDWVVVKLSRKEAFLLDDLGSAGLRHPTNQSYGTGPYKLEATADKVRLTAFDRYYRGHPQIGVVEIHSFGEQRASWAALMRGEIDAVHEIAPNALDFLQADGQTGVNTYAFVRPYYIQLVFNVRHPILKNPAVRQALSYGVDRQQIVDLALNKQGMVAEGPIWPYHWAYSTARRIYTHNSEAATLRLDSTGLKLKPASVKGQMPSRLRIRCLTVAGDSRYEKIALILQKQLYEIGVDLEIETAPVAAVVKRLVSGDFDTVLIQRIAARSLAWTYLTFHSSKQNTGYKAADRILDRLRETIAEAEIRTLVSDLQQTFHDDPPAIFITWPKVARVVSTRFQVPDEAGRVAPGTNSRFQVPDEAGRDVLGSLWQWRPADVSR